jgi:putative ABC transport system substrate-binding protein
VDQSRRRFIQRAWVLGLSLSDLALWSGCGLAPAGGSGRKAPSVPRIGYLGLGAQPVEGSPSIGAFRQGLRDLGYVDGETILVEWRFADDADQLTDLAAELIGANVELIVVGGTPQALAASQATSTIPIVMASVDDPVGAGLVASLARPAGNVTGLSFQSLGIWAKQLELLKEIIPGLSRVAVSWYPDNQANATALNVSQEAARSLRLELLTLEVRSSADFQAAFETAVIAGAGAMVDLALPLSLSHRTLIADLAAQYRLPSAYGDRSFVVAGGLMSYGASLTDNFRRSAAYVDRILKGARPADLPVEQPTKFDCVVNLSTARVLALAIPQSVLLQATEIIQ